MSPFNFCTNKLIKALNSHASSTTCDTAGSWWAQTVQAQHKARQTTFVYYINPQEFQKKLSLLPRLKVTGGSRKFSAAGLCQPCRTPGSPSLSITAPSRCSQGSGDRCGDRLICHSRGRTHRHMQRTHRHIHDLRRQVYLILPGSCCSLGPWRQTGRRWQRGLPRSASLLNPTFLIFV